MSGRAAAPRRSALVALVIAAAAGVGAARLAPEAEARTPSAARAVQPPRTGAQVYTATCAACHLPDGTGNGETYPPLAGSEWVTGDEARLVRVILHGLTGPIDVEGESYSGVMPPWGPTLKDEEIAAVATYVRTAWGNKAPAVSAATVARLRAAHASRTAPWTAAELAQAPIPVQK